MFRFRNFLTILTLSLPIACHANVLKAANSAVFGGTPNVIKSPDGRYEIIDNKTRWLAFKRRGDRSAKRFYSYERNVDILWSPDSKCFALNDNMGSNVASALLFKVTDLSKPLDLAEKLYAKPSKKLPSMTGNDHIYYNVRKWISPTKLEFVVTGYGKRGFALIYQYDLKGSFRCIKRLETYSSDLLF
jgi:hypothetical protein